ncbi:MAG: four helix bundle protein [Phycisphaerae bacterium]
MQDFRKLSVWRKSHELTLAVYRVTAAFPKEERYGLVSQMRRSSSSIPTSIAEGCGRGGQRGFAHFLRTAGGSASELEYQVILARDLHLLSEDQAIGLAESVSEIKRMLCGLTKSVKAQNQLKTDN